MIQPLLIGDILALLGLCHSQSVLQPEELCERVLDKAKLGFSHQRDHRQGHPLHGDGSLMSAVSKEGNLKYPIVFDRKTLGLLHKITGVLYDGLPKGP